MNVQKLWERQKRTLSHILILQLSVVTESRPLKLFTTHYPPIQRQIVTFRLKQTNKSYLLSVYFSSLSVNWSNCEVGNTNIWYIQANFTPVLVIFDVPKHHSHPLFFAPWFYWALIINGSYWALLGLTEPHLGLTGPYLVLLVLFNIWRQTNKHTLYCEADISSSSRRLKQFTLIKGTLA